MCPVCGASLDRSGDAWKFDPSGRVDNPPLVSDAAGLAMNAAQLALVCAFRPGARERHGHGLSHGHGGAGGALKRLGSEIAPEAASLEHVT